MNEHETVPRHLEQVRLHEYSEAVPRQRAAAAAPGTCGLLPARAFRPMYPLGCLRVRLHEGRHSPDPDTADRADRFADARKTAGTA